MAKSKPARRAADAVITLNLVLIGSLMAAAVATPPTFLMVADTDAAPLLAAGLIEQNPNPDTHVDGKKPTRLTEAGKTYATENMTAIQSAQAAAFTAQPAAAAPAAAPAVAGTPVAAAPAEAPKPKFAVVTGLTLPATIRKPPVGGGARPETYPFSQLEVGAAFFIPATADKPQPERSYASTVSSARERYAVEIPGQFRKSRSGKMVPAVKYDRDFKIRAWADGKEFGFPGVKGAIVQRVAPEAAQPAADAQPAAGQAAATA